jgi:hypothetical protein
LKPRTEPVEKRETSRSTASVFEIEVFNQRVHLEKTLGTRARRKKKGRWKRLNVRGSLACF